MELNHQNRLDHGGVSATIGTRGHLGEPVKEGRQMKFCCPYCRHIFERPDRGFCPSCQKAIRPRRVPSKIRTGRTQRDRRSPILAMPAGPMSVFLIFSQRPRFLFWVLGLTAVVVIMLSTVKVKPVALYVAPTKVERTRYELGVMRTALEWFRVNCKRYPTAEEGLKALVVDPGVPGWQGFYIEELPPDLWGHEFRYASSNDAVRLSSIGPDGLADTSDDIPAPPPDYKSLMLRLTNGVASATGTVSKVQ